MNFIVLYVAKQNKQNTSGHLFAGVFLIFAGVEAFNEFDNILTLGKHLAEIGSINSPDEVRDIALRQTLQYIIPLI
ncbi:MAG: hypothetical protein ACYCSZ_09260 [Burkholderiales bacterium]